MKEEKGGWSTVGQKTGSKGKEKKDKQDVDESLLAEDEKVLVQYGPEGKGKKLPIHPDSDLDAIALNFLAPILDFTAFLNKTFSRLNGVKGCTSALAENDELLDATIFCFKAIGGCVDRATKRLEEQGKIVPLFWRQLITLRNSLIHHLLNDSLSDKCLSKLGIIVTDWSQIYDYFRAICDPAKKNTQLKIVKHEERYKRFHDVIELALQLRREFPKSERGKQDVVTQESYLLLIRRVIRKIMRYSEGTNFNEDEMQYLQKKHPAEYYSLLIKYYALHNCLEFLATLTTPNVESRLLSPACRDKLLRDNAKAIECLDGLGESRNIMMHTSKVTIPNRKLCDNILNIRDVLPVFMPVDSVDEDLKKPKQPAQAKGAVTSPTKGSSSKLIKKFGVKFAPEKEMKPPSVQVVQQQLPTKVAIMPKNPAPPSAPAKQEPGKQGSPKKAPPKTPSFKK